MHIRHPGGPGPQHPGITDRGPAGWPAIRRGRRNPTLPGCAASVDQRCGEPQMPSTTGRESWRASATSAPIPRPRLAAGTPAAASASRRAASRATVIQPRLLRRSRRLDGFQPRDTVDQRRLVDRLPSWGGKPTVVRTCVRCYTILTSRRTNVRMTGCGGRVKAVSVDDGALPGLQLAGLVRSVRAPQFDGVTFTRCCASRR